jgi:hypothetical protein
MAWRTILKVVGAVLTAMWTTVSLVLEAKGIAPGMHWQYLALGGFWVFAGVMAWVAWDVNKHAHQLEQELASRRPIITLGDKTTAETRVREADDEVDILLSPTFHNIGEKPAYQTRIRIGYAPAESPELFLTKPELNNPNRLDSGLQIVPPLKLTQKFNKQPDGKLGVQSRVVLLYCDIQYSDAPVGGTYYKDEWWFAYPLGAPSLGMPHLEQKNALEPFVRKAYMV